MKICFIGYGNMAKAISQGIAHDPDLRIFATAPSLPANGSLNGVTTHYDNTQFISDADIVVLAVKPAKTATVLQSIKQHVPAKCVIVSIVAGITLARLAKECPPQQAIIRSMPNIAISVGKGATPLIANANVSSRQQQQVEQLFQGSGITTWLDDEHLIDVFTALSGSGPAYIFLFIEAMIKAAEKLGLPSELASLFTMQTFAGALAMLEQNPDPEALRKKVTSPAGTTAAALAILQQRDFESILLSAMQAACERSVELGKII